MSSEGTYLDRIVADVRARLGDAPESSSHGSTAGPTRSLEQSIRLRRTAGELAVIAEVKRRSPSVGAIDLDVDPAAQATAYVDAGAAGISVLTEPDHFGGSLDDLVAVRDVAVDVPVLRKDFIVEASQLDAARAAGGDAVLLIAALHDVAALATLLAHARSLGLDVLLEVHDELDLAKALATDATMIGINNRDLRSFEVDLAVTERLAPLVPEDRLVVAESGVRTPEDARRLRRVGVDAVLVGEALMRAPQPGGLLRELATATPTTTVGPGASS
jgi:indole-3-glycerol phosphate synthase